MIGLEGAIDRVAFIWTSRRMHSVGVRLDSTLTLSICAVGSTAAESGNPLMRCTFLCMHRIGILCTA